MAYIQPQPRVTRLYWLLNKLTEKDLSLQEIDAPVSFLRLFHDFLLLKRLGYVSFKVSSEGVPGPIHLYRLPTYDEVRKAYLDYKHLKFEKVSA